MRCLNLCGTTHIPRDHRVVREISHKIGSNGSRTRLDLPGAGIDLSGFPLILPKLRHPHQANPTETRNSISPVRLGHRACRCSQVVSI